MSEERADRGDEGAAEQAERLEREARRMEERAGELEREVGGAREDWVSKKRSGLTAPGAQDPPEDLDVSGAEPYVLSEGDGEASADAEEDSEDDDSGR